jgi:hypothetical protein
MLTGASNMGFHWRKIFNISNNIKWRAPGRRKSRKKCLHTFKDVFVARLTCWEGKRAGWEGGGGGEVGT